MIVPAGYGPEMHDSPIEDPREVLILSGAGESERLVASVLTPNEAEATRYNTGGPLIPLDQAAKLAPEMQRVLQGGQIMRVVSGPAGDLVTSGKDTLAIARNADGSIAGPLRFDGGPRNVRHVAAPSAIFQVAGALTLQHYLDTMSKQLEALQKGVQDIKDMLVHAQKGDLYAAQRFVVQQEQLVAEGTKVGVDLSSAIEAHLGSVRSVYSAVRDAMRNRASQVVELIDDTGKIVNHKVYDEGLDKMLTEGRRDAVTLLVAMDLIVRLLRLQQVAALERALGQGPGLRQTALEEIAEMREDFGMLGPLFERWLVSDQAIALHEAGLKKHHKFSTARRLLKLRDYQLATIDLRLVLGQSPADLLPTLPIGGSSYVIDCQRSDDGEVYAQIAELRPPSG
jgi:hypothetical protein